MSLPYLIVFLIGTIAGWKVLEEGHPVFVSLWVMGWTFAYVLSIHLHPRRPCWACAGEGRHWGRFYRYSLRPCSRCDGKGWEMRWGAIALDIDSRGTLAAFKRRRGTTP